MLNERWREALPGPGDQVSSLASANSTQAVILIHDVGSAGLRNFTFSGWQDRLRHAELPVQQARCTARHQRGVLASHRCGIACVHAAYSKTAYRNPHRNQQGIRIEAHMTRRTRDGQVKDKRGTRRALEEYATYKPTFLLFYAQPGAAEGNNAHSPQALSRKKIILHERTHPARSCVSAILKAPSYGNTIHILLSVLLVVWVSTSARDFQEVWLFGKSMRIFRVN